MIRTLLLILSLIVGTIAFSYFATNTCQLPLQCHDSPAVVASEERDVLHEAKTGVFDPPGPEPLKVRISGRDATLTVAGPVDPNWLNYAYVWFTVFQRYHGGRNAVRMHIAVGVCSTGSAHLSGGSILGARSNDTS
jgi:hypothetical protein